MTELAWNPVGGVGGFVVMVCALLVVLAFVGPRHRSLSRPQQVTLTALRIAVIVVIAFIMARPTIVFTQNMRQRATLALLVDSTRSMQVTDASGGGSRWELLKSQLDSAQDELDRLGEEIDLKAFAFSEQLLPLNIAEGNVALPEEPDGRRTAIGQALEDTLRREAAGRLLGVLLMSDGAERSLPPRNLPPQRAARDLARAGIPLYTLPVGLAGSGGDKPDLAITDLLTSETVFAEAPMEVSAELSVRGYANQNVAVQLLWEMAEGEMEPVDTQQMQVALDRFGRQQQRIRFSYVPPEPGEYKLTVRAVDKDGEQLTSNNARSTFVSVRKGGIRVLLLHGAQQVGGVSSGPERRALKWALDASPDMLFEDRLIRYVGEPFNFAREAPLTEWDVVLLLNVDTQGLARTSLQELADWVEERGGLMMIGGFHSFGPGGYAGSPLSDVLPIRMERSERQIFGEAPREDVHLPGEVAVEITPTGRFHPMVDLSAVEGSSANPWDDLPPLLGANRFSPAQVKAGALVLLQSPDKNPLLVVQAFGNGRSAAWAGDSTARWRQYGQGEALIRFWRQVILWLAQKDQDKEGEVWVRLDERRLFPSTPLSFQVGANLPNGEAAGELDFQVVAQLPDGREVPIAVAERGEATMGQLEDTSQPGDYVIRVTAREGDQVLGEARARMLVMDQDLELDTPVADVELLSSLAATTAENGGRMLAPGELNDLLRQLREQTSELYEEKIREWSLWDNWPILLLFVALLGTEWYLRKRWGLV